MAKRASKDVPIFVLGGYDLRGSLTQFEDMRSAMLERTDVLGDLYESYDYVGVRSAELSQEGFFEEANEDIDHHAHRALSSGRGVERVLIYGLEGTATGAGFEGWSGAIEVLYTVQATIGAMTKAKATYKSIGPVEHGKLLQLSPTWQLTGTSGTTGNTTANPVDNGVSTTGGAGYFAYRSQGNANARIIHSSDAITWANLFTFTAAMDATSSGNTNYQRGAQRLVTTAAIERYTAIDITTASSTGFKVQGANFRSVFGLVRGLTS